MYVGSLPENASVVSAEAWAKFRSLEPESVGLLWTERPDGTGGSKHRRDVYTELARIPTLRTINLRVGWPQRMTTAALVAETASAIAEIPAELAPTAVVRLLNEPNHPGEGGWTATTCAHTLAEALPPIRSVWKGPVFLPPASWGFPTADDWWQAFLDELEADTGEPLGGFDGAYVNLYAHLVAQRGPALATAIRSRGRRARCSEFNIAGISGQPRLDWIRSAIALLDEAGYESADLFIGHGRSYGAWDESYVLTPDETRAVGARPKPAPNATPLYPPLTEGTRSDPPEGTQPNAGPQPPQEQRTVPQLTGRGAWVWYVGKCAEQGQTPAQGIIARARAGGIRWLAIKGGDAETRADDGYWPQLSPDLVAELHAADLKVYGWAYGYGDNPDRETAIGKRILTTGVDGLIWDVEAEYEGKPAVAAAVARSLRDACGDKLLGYSPLPVISLHQALPFVQWNDVVDVVLPQFYRRMLGGGDLTRWAYGTLWQEWDRWSTTWLSWGHKAPPVSPVGEAYLTDPQAGTESPQEVTDFELEIQRRGVASWSYWELGQSTPDQLAAMLATLTSAPIGALDDATKAILRTRLDGIWQETERLAAIEHSDHAKAIQKQVGDLKTAVGI